MFHSSYDCVLAKKMSMPSIFHRPKQMEVRTRQIRTIRWVWYDSLVKIDNVFHGLESGMGPGVIVLQEKSCLLWTCVGVTSLRLGPGIEKLLSSALTGSLSSLLENSGISI